MPRVPVHQVMQVLFINSAQCYGGCEPEVPTLNDKLRLVPRNSRFRAIFAHGLGLAQERASPDA